MTTPIVITLDDRDVQEALKKLAAKVGNLTPVLDKIGSFYTRNVRSNFDAQADPAGQKWQKLAAATLMMGLASKKGFKKKGSLSKKGKQYLQGKRILIASGNLMEHVQHQATADSLIVGVVGGKEAIKYAAIHQFGGKAGRGKKVTIPARPYLAENEGESMKLADRDKKMILEMLAEA
jgi:phage virion morphogenesis protein